MAAEFESPDLVAAARHWSPKVGVERARRKVGVREFERDNIEGNIGFLTAATIRGCETLISSMNWCNSWPR